MTQSPPPLRLETDPGKLAEEEELPMYGYWFTFEPTGVIEIDRILSAIACASRWSHSTEGWIEGDGLGDEPSHIERIEFAARAAADTISTLSASNGALVAIGTKILAKLDSETASVTQWDADELRAALAHPTTGGSGT